MKKVHLFIIALVVVVASVFLYYRWAMPCRYYNEVRFDSAGSGYFGASRGGGTRKHSGLDFRCKPGETVFSPISGRVVRLTNAYPDDSRFKGIVISGHGGKYEIKMFYFVPSVSDGDFVLAGMPIGSAQSISSKYGGSMLDHLHLEVRRLGQLVDPLLFYKTIKQPRA